MCPLWGTCYTGQFVLPSTVIYKARARGQCHLIGYIAKIPVIRPGFFWQNGNLLFCYFAAVLTADGLNVGSIRLFFATGVPIRLAHAVKIRQFHTVNSHIAPFGITARFHYGYALAVFLARDVHAFHIVRKNFVHMALMARSTGA